MKAGFQLGNERLNDRGYECCGKPVGCTMTHDGCAHLQHPWKRAVVFGDPTVRCQARSLEGQCGLLNGHAEPCVIVSIDTN